MCTCSSSYCEAGRDVVWGVGGGGGDVVDAIVMIEVLCICEKGRRNRGVVGTSCRACAIQTSNMSK